MNWIELIAEFIVEIIHYAAWPVVILVVLLVFRKPIVSLLGRLKKISIGDKFLEFMVSELHEKVSEKIRYFDVTKETLKWEHFESALVVIAFNSGMLALELLRKPSKRTATNDGVYVQHHADANGKAADSIGIAPIFTHD